MCYTHCTQGHCPNCAVHTRCTYTVCALSMVCIGQRTQTLGMRGTRWICCTCCTHGRCTCCTPVCTVCTARHVLHALCVRSLHALCALSTKALQALRTDTARTHCALIHAVPTCACTALLAHPVSCALHMQTARCTRGTWTLHTGHTLCTLHAVHVQHNPHTHIHTRCSHTGTHSAPPRCTSHTLRSAHCTLTPRCAHPQHLHLPAVCVHAADSLHAAPCTCTHTNHARRTQTPCVCIVPAAPSSPHQLPTQDPQLFP